MKKLLTLLTFVLLGIIAKAQTGPQETQNSKPSVDTSDVFVSVQKPATFPGGVDKLNKFFRKNSKYPITEDSGAAVVFVQFIVERDGSLTSVKIGRGVNLELDTEAIRLVKASGLWVPGEQHGNKVRQQYGALIKFRQ